MWSVFLLPLFHLSRTESMRNALSGEKSHCLVLHIRRRTVLLSIIVHKMWLSNKAPNSLAKSLFGKYEERVCHAEGWTLILRSIKD